MKSLNFGKNDGPVAPPTARTISGPILEEDDIVVTSPEQQDINGSRASSESTIMYSPTPYCNEPNEPSNKKNKKEPREEAEAADPGSPE